jgi:sulfur relay (sulfurtransferase) DsrC/TusE family protein
VLNRCQKVFPVFRRIVAQVETVERVQQQLHEALLLFRLFQDSPVKEVQQQLHEALLLFQLFQDSPAKEVQQQLHEALLLFQLFQDSPAKEVQQQGGAQTSSLFRMTTLPPSCPSPQALVSSASAA